MLLLEVIAALGRVVGTILVAALTIALALVALFIAVTWSAWKGRR